MTLTNSQAAAHGQLSMYAMDMYRVGGATTPAPAAGLIAAGWTILAYIVGGDTLLRDGPIEIAPDIVYYGFVAHHTSGETVAVVRGTDGLIEWLEDAEFVPFAYAPTLPLPGPPAGLKVEQGFWTLYQSLMLADAAGQPLGPLAATIATLRGVDGPVTVVGHSLGAALATYLTLDLARGPLGARVSACLFASPHTGNAVFADLFDRTVLDYRLFNYILDVVPRMPLGPDYAPLPRRTILQPDTAEARIKVDVSCNHHVVCYAAMLDYEGTMQAITPTPPGEEGSVPCILGPETGHPTLAKQLVAALSGVIPV